MKIEKNQSFDITICIPIYNTELWLSECLKSVVSQSIWGKIFVILVDDGSNDNSRQIACDFAQRYSEQVKLIHHTENKGLLAARYTAIIHVQTSYMMFLDSDDLLRSGACASLYNAITENEADIIMGRMHTLDRNKIIDRNTAYINRLFEDYQTNQNLRLVDNYWFAGFPVCGKIYRSKIVKIAAYGAGSRDFPAVSSGEDHLLSSAIFMKSQKFYLLKKPVYLYRVNHESLTNKSSLKNLVDYLLVVLNIVKLSIFHHNRKLWELAVDIFNILEMRFQKAEFGGTNKQDIIDLLESIREIMHSDKKMPDIPSILLQENQIMNDFNIHKLNHILNCPEYIFPQSSEPESPKVSIIIPVYNVCDYLDHCLESVLLQSEQAIEIIVVDDVSSDGSWDLIQNYARRDSRIIALRHDENQGQGAARNTGLEIAQAPWVMFLDGDDYIDYNAVKILLKQIRSNPKLEMVLYGAKYINKNGSYWESFYRSNEDILIKEPFIHYCKQEYPVIFHCVWSQFTKRTLFLDNPDLRFPLNTCVEDFVLSIQIFWCLRQPILFVKEQLYYYRYRENSTSNTYNEKIPGLINGIHIIDQWSKKLDEESLFLLQKKVSYEIIVWLKIINSDTSFRMFLSAIPMDYNVMVLNLVLKENAKIQNDRWYRFGMLARRDKLWFVCKVLLKKAKLYRTFLPVVKIIRLYCKNKK